MDLTPCLFLTAQWHARNLQYQKADSVCDLIESKILKKPLSTKLFQAFILFRFENASYSGHSVEYLFDLVVSHPLIDKPDNVEFKIRCLLHKSNWVRRLDGSHVKHAYTAGLYALYLAKKYDVQLNGRDQPAYQHGINLYMEDHLEEAQFFFDIATANCSDMTDPNCRKIKCLTLTNMGLDSINSIEPEVLASLFNSTQYIPEIDNFIKLQLNFASINTEDDIQSFIEDIDQGHNCCTTDFFNTAYLIDDLLSIDSLDLAQLYMDKLEGCSELELGRRYWVAYRSQRLQLAIYEQTCQRSDLEDSYDKILKTKYLANQWFGNSIDLHYADVIYVNNKIHIENLYRSLQSDEQIVSRDSILRQLIESKQLFDKISNAHSIFEGRQVSQNTIDRYAEIQNQIDYWEQGVNEYRDTIFEDLSVYDKLYFLYEEQYALEKEIKTIPKSAASLTLVSYPELRDYLSRSGSQAVDIQATEDYYYLTIIRSDTLIMDRVLRYDVDVAVDFLLAEIKDKRPLDHYYNSVLLQYITQHLDISLYNLIILPDNKMGELPFESLVTSARSDTTLLYLGDYYNITYDYNLDKIIPVSDATLARSINLYSYSSQSTIADRSLKTIPELSFGLNEIDEISALYTDPNVMSGHQLKPEPLLASLHTPILHFSTHAQSNPDNLLDNYFYVRDLDEQAKKMYGYEIKNKTLDNNLVILSSCDSGTGSYKAGAGTFSLSRDFLQAGAQTVIKSLWPVNEISTSKLMVSFHKFLNQGYTAGHALALAKRDLKSTPQFAHPYYWAGFVLEGNGALRLEN